MVNSGTLLDLLRELRAARPDADVALVVKAYLSAESWHQGQLRKSGDRYITHPVAVARILVGLGADDATLCAALLHDVLDDTACTAAELQTEFGSEIADLVHQASALDPTDDGHAAALTVLAAGRGGDKRVLFIKIADRLHKSAVLLPAGSRARWREEWLAELALLPTRRARAIFAAQIVRGIGRLAVTLRVSRRRIRR